MTRCEILSSARDGGGARLDAMVEERQLTELMIAYQAGDLAAFEQLYAILSGEATRYFSRTHRDRSVVHDLVQDLFLEVHRSRRTYTPPLPVRPWIFGIARNVSARSRRAFHLQPVSGAPLEPGHDYKRQYDPTGVAFAASVAESAVEGSATAMMSTDALDIESALTALPPSNRGPWLLHHVFGFGFDSIAERLGITVMAAKLRSSRATRALRLALQLTGKPSR